MSVFTMLRHAFQNKTIAFYCLNAYLKTAACGKDMHETSIAQNIIAIVQETLKEQPASASSVKTVRVVLGEMIAVVPELLHHAYDSLVSNTQLEQSRLEISIIPISAHCLSCDYTFGLKEFDFSCPGCHSSNIEVQTGNEFFIKEIEVES